MDGGLVSLPGRDLSEDTRRQIGRMAEQGLSNREIARRLGVTVNTARRWADRWANGEGLENRPKPVPETPPALKATPEVVERMKEMRLAGMHSGRIAEELDFHPATVTRILQREGLGFIREVDGEILTA